MNQYLKRILALALTLLIIIGGIGFIVWDDISIHKWHIRLQINASPAAHARMNVRSAQSAKATASTSSIPMSASTAAPAQAYVLSRLPRKPDSFPQKRCGKAHGFVLQDRRLAAPFLFGRPRCTLNIRKKEFRHFNSPLRRKSVPDASCRKAALQNAPKKRILPLAVPENSRAFPH